MREAMKKLISLDRERGVITHIAALLGWDQETYMPESGIDERAEQLAIVENLAHEKAVNPGIGELLNRLEGEKDLSGQEKAYLRVSRREYDKETKLPAGLVSEMARQTSLSQAAWVQARKNNDFKRFAPHLATMIRLNLEKASALNPGAPPYDVLLDLYEIGSTERSIADVFAVMKRDLVEILGAIRSRPQSDDSFLRRRVSPAAQARMSQYFMGALGFDKHRGRLDTAAHPFTTTLGRDDIRITTRYIEDYFPSSVFSTIHEAGHALYEMGLEVGPDYSGTRLADAASMAVHESQSRMWENIIGRSLPFWGAHYGHIVPMAEGALEGVALEDFYKGVNRVEASLIRTEADEVSYGLHVIARFELESALIKGDLAVEDLPGAWNDTMHQTLGVEVPDDRRGCLQDIHWSMGSFGYFPSYALGNLYAAQFWTAMKAQIPSLERSIAAGDCSPALDWLREKVHREAAALLPSELVLKATGSSLDPSHFTGYLRKKYSAIYGF
ncbi:MAG: carboxypeptidase M32 [Treponema sp.]|jgi:carboxypeptidase Taq|nr:carboxypeptidase M32 [Treponema sp.]VBB40511.1 Thermostable carboxypeptidase 1 [uncultured Spirochaetota bacterium]